MQVNVSVPLTATVLTLGVTLITGRVVALISADRAERLPAGSNAATAYACVAWGSRPASDQAGPVAEAICRPSLKMAYPLTATLSEDADQDRLMREEEAAAAARLPGTDGGVVSGSVVALAAAD